MPTITVKLKQVNDATSVAHIRSHAIDIDRPAAKGGHDNGAMGGELLLASLGGCFNSNLLAAIKARDLPIDDVEITVSGELAATPARFSSVDMVVHSAYADREALGKLVTMSERACIVANTLKHAVDLSVRLS
ncbi:MAG: OsmC family protein [Chloroflexi bacterium]|nr:OsmC family protein [Chloroflexota bacterium]MCY3583685.1 OsmC family protein [Chloroflexota bacterium]MCY3716965.1 OsmC family protein [Chloroflexota bacterium]MDE2650149.1 OsmC family protein [Chloroflexota bacterium]MXX50428.1 OsmC family protein [Chloroflexota bacterium]